MNNMKEYTVQGTKYRMRLFERILDGDEAYLVGYLLGDGGFNKGTHKRKSRMFLTSINQELIYGVQSKFIPDTPINKRIPVNKNRPEIKSEKYSYRIQFPSKFYDTFNKFGLLNTKENRTYHNIPKQFMPDMILGLFDADGHISWGRRKDRNRLWANWGITHPNLKMLVKLQRYLSDELDISSYVNPRKTEEVYDLKLSHREDIIDLCEFIYNNASTTMYNKNKCMHFYEFKSEYEKQYR